MVIHPKIRGFICITAHPVGCAASVREQIELVKSRGPLPLAPKRVLVIGASGGYGLATRIAAAFGNGASTIGLFFERPSQNGKPASAGWYNSVAFEQEAKAAGLYARSFNGDAFSDEMKKKVVDAIRADLGQIDLIVYSIASPRRTDPETGILHKSVLKTLERPYTALNLDTDKVVLTEVTVEPATPEEIEGTVKVMGGEDWARWIDVLEAEDLLAPGASSVSYSYIGPEVTRPFYREGTIGHAKNHLEATAHELDARLRQRGGCAYVSVNKAVVTQASSAIPVVPLYLTLLIKVMKERGLHEDCIHQIDRLFREKLTGNHPTEVDEKGRLRLDDWEMRDEVQAEVVRRWREISTENLDEIGDWTGYRANFLQLFGFGMAGVNYDADVNPDVGFGYSVE